MLITAPDMLKTVTSRIGHSVCGQGLLAIMLLLIGLAGSSTWAHEFHFTVPQIAGDIKAVEFADVNSDGIPEILAVDDALVVLYDFANDSVLHTVPLAAGENVVSLHLADANDDQVVDIVIAINRRVFLYDGSQLFSLSRDLTFPSPECASATVWNFGPFPCFCLAIVDLDKDGDNETVIGTHQIDGDFWLRTTSGLSFRSESLDDSLANQSGTMIDHVDPLPDVAGLPSAVLQIGEYTEMDGPGYESFRISLELTAILPTFSLLSKRDRGAARFPNASSRSYDKIVESFECAVELSGQLDILSIRMASHRTEVETDSGWVSTGTSSSLLQRRRVQPSGDLTVVWQTELTTSLSAFAYHPIFPNSFFAFEGDLLAQFSLADGSFQRYYYNVPSGWRQWSNMFGFSDPHLVVVNGAAVAILSFDIVTDVADATSPLPISPMLKQNYPNPFNPTTQIRFALAEGGDVTIDVLNVIGQRVATLVTGYAGPGHHTVVWDASDEPTGVYFYRMSAGKYTETRKMLLLK